MESWSVGVMVRNPILLYSNTPLFQFFGFYLNISLNFLLQLSSSSLLGNLMTTI
jgi:hypothetical protein